MTIDSNVYQHTIEWKTRLAYEIPLLSELVDNTNKKQITVLDLGCGSGFHLHALAKKYPQHNFIGIDIEKNAIDFAQKEANDQKLPITYKCGNFLTDTNLYIPPIDLVFSIGNSLSLIWENTLPETVLQKIASFMIPNGQLFFQILNNDNPRKGYVISKLKTDENGIEYLTIKRFQPNFSTNRMEVEFLFLTKQKNSDTFSKTESKNAWPLLKSEDIKNLLLKNSLNKLQFWANYSKEEFFSQKAESLLCLAVKANK